ncbi:uncharacterized protein LOC144534356 [Sander vitreus]
MAWTGVITLFALPLAALGRDIFAYLGDSVTLTASEECENWKVIHRLKDDRALDVATSVDGVWMMHESSRVRIERGSKLSVVLTRVNYNDNGFYEFTCGSRVVTTIRLEVFLPFDISVTEGEQVKLPCHSYTADKPAKPIRWEKDGELVYERQQPSGEIRYGTGFKGRNVSLSPNWYSIGDLSLTLGRAQPEDEGVYVCYTDRPERTKGEPAAVRVKITTKRNPDQITCAPQIVPRTQNATEENKMGTKTILCVTAAVILSACLCFGCGWWVKSFRSNVSSGPSGGGSPTDRMDELDLEEQPFTGPQVNGEPLYNNL